MATLPDSVLNALTGGQPLKVAHFTEEPITTSSGAATGAVVRISGELHGDDGLVRPFRLVRKTFTPLGSGAHTRFAGEQSHWAYWRRELLAYASGILPAGPGLAAPRSYGTDGDDVYLEDVVGDRPQAEVAAEHLGDWQTRSELPDLTWLTSDQLAQRVAATDDLDWQAVDADGRVVKLWQRRHEMLDRMRALPQVLSHGDYGLGNLVARDHDTVAYDWGTLGVAPVGSDLAHLALSSGIDAVANYLAGSGARWTADQVGLGFRGTLAVVGSSRTHWMLSRGIELPNGYVDVLWEHRPE